MCPVLVYLMADTSPCLLNRPLTQGYKSSLNLLKSFFFFFQSGFFPPLHFDFCFFFSPSTYISFSFAQHHLYSFPLEGTLGLQSLEKSLPSPGFDRSSAPLSSVACFSKPRLSGLPAPSGMCWQEEGVVQPAGWGLLFPLQALLHLGAQKERLKECPEPQDRSHPRS